MEYTEIITRDDIVERLAKRGYNLKAEGVLDTTHFIQEDDAIDDFVGNSFDLVVSLITEYKGKTWTDAFLEDMSIEGMENASDKQTEFNKVLIKAIIEQCIFNYDNGDVTATADADNHNKKIAPKTASILWNNYIIG